MLEGKFLAIEIQTEFENGRIGKVREWIEKFKELENKINYLDYLIKEARKDLVKETDAYKKAFKHEFLTQIKYFPGTLAELLESTLEVLPNPKINLSNYIVYLIKSEYFTFGKGSDDSILVLTDKAERYLENEANVSLKK